MTWELQNVGASHFEVINRSIRDTAYFVRVSHPRLDAPGHIVEVEEVGPGSGVGFYTEPRRGGVADKESRPVEITWYADRDKSGDKLIAARALPWGRESIVVLINPSTVRAVLVICGFPLNATLPGLPVRKPWGTTRNLRSPLRRFPRSS